MAFGTALHVTGKDPALLEQTLRQAAGANHRISPAQTSLEDVFIYMMGGAQDNMAATAAGKPAAQAGRSRPHDTREPS